MRDGLTRKLERPPEQDHAFTAWLARWQATLVVVSGAQAGTEYPLEQARVTLGRGEDADLVFADSAMSREHAAVEFAGEGFRVRDLGSMNGTLLNGSETKAGDLKNGDRIEVGEHTFQFVLEKRRKRPKTYVLPEE